MSGVIGTTGAGNPLIAQGTLNRLRGSVVIPNYPSINVTAPYLGKQGIRLALEGQSTVFLPTMTGAVTSLEPYMMVSCTMALLKTQNLASLYKTQMETQATIGPVNVTPDTSILPIYNLINCAIETVDTLSFAGDDPTFTVTIKGYYNINTNLWSLT